MRGEGGEPRLDASFSELEGLEGVANAAFQAHADAPDTRHMAKVGKHFKGEGAGGDQEEKIARIRSLEGGKDFFPDVEDCGDDEGVRVRSLNGTDEALRADGVVGVGAAMGGKAQIRTL